MGGNLYAAPQSPVAPIDPVSQYVPSSRAQQANYLNTLFGDQSGTSSMMTGKQGFGSGLGLEGTLGNNWLQTLGAGTGIATDLFGLYAGMQGLDIAKTGLNNQAKVSNYNMANKSNFINGTIDAFGSGQAKAQNQFAKTL